MGLRYRKSIKLAPGVKVNLNKNSTSVTFGGKGLHKTISSTGRTTTTVGIPGTGLSYSETKTRKKSENVERPTELPDVGPLTLDEGNGEKKPKKKKKGCGCLSFIILILIVLFAIAECTPLTVEKISIGAHQAVMDINANQTLEITTEPDSAATDGATISKMSVISSNEDVLNGEIDDGELVISSTSIEGTATIYIKADDANSNKVKITVADKEKQKEESRAKEESKAKKESEEREASRAKKESQEQESREQALEESRKQEEAAAAAAQTTQEQETYVYVSQTGSKYHSSSSCSNMNNPSHVPLSRAKQMGLTPCKKCY